MYISAIETFTFKYYDTGYNRCYNRPGLSFVFSQRDAHPMQEMYKDTYNRQYHTVDRLSL